MTYGITNIRLLTPDGVRPGCLLIRDGTIAAVHLDVCELPATVSTIDGAGRIIAPGLIDVHVHGGGGFDLMSSDIEAIRGYARWIARRGVLGFLVSTSGRDHADVLRKLRALRPVIGRVQGGARVLGFHLEGPYINPVRKGAFPAQWLRAPSPTEYRELFEASGGAIRQVTLAPELPGADALIDAVVASGATAAIGHTDATYEEAMAAIGRGCTHVTHTFNAMRPFGHRDPGVIGAVLTSDAVTCELIADGAHVAYAAGRLLLRAKGHERMALITDGMPLAGTVDGDGVWEGQPIRVEAGKAVRVSDGTIIGGVITLDETVRNAVAHMGMSAHAAWTAASAVPAAAVGVGDSCGALRPGADADFVALDDALRVTDIWLRGERLAAG